jgi:hypothetical protein
MLLVEVEVEMMTPLLPTQRVVVRLSMARG